MSLEPKVQLVYQALQNFLSQQNVCNFAINCETREEAEDFLTAVHCTGRVWSKTKKIIEGDGTKNIIWKYKQNTCYRIFFDDEEILSAQKKFYEKKGLEIFSFSELLTFAPEKAVLEYKKATQQEVGEVVQESPSPQTEETLPSENTGNAGNTENTIEFVTETEKVEETERPESVISAENIVEKVKSENVEKANKSPIREVETVHADKLPTSQEKLAVEESAENFETNPTRSEAVAKETKANSKNTLCMLLNLEVNQPFSVFSRDTNIFDEKEVYRINAFGIREKLLSQRSDLWVTCTDELQLAYLIENPQSVVTLN